MLRHHFHPLIAAHSSSLLLRLRMWFLFITMFLLIQYLFSFTQFLLLLMLSLEITNNKQEKNGKIMARDRGARVKRIKREL